MKKCKICGDFLSDNSTFCLNCGNQLNDDSNVNQKQLEYTNRNIKQISAKFDNLNTTLLEISSEVKTSRLCLVIMTAITVLSLVSSLIFGIFTIAGIAK